MEIQNSKVKIQKSKVKNQKSKVNTRIAKSLPLVLLYANQCCFSDPKTRERIHLFTYCPIAKGIPIEFLLNFNF